MLNILNEQKNFFETGKTRNIEFRIEMLQKLKTAILTNEQNLNDALKKDLNKSPFESYQTETGLIISELNLAIKNLKKWSKPQKVKTPLFLFKAESLIYTEPYGLSLIIAPWNYPLQLSILPLIGAISAGNCAVLKLSEFSVNTSKLIKEILNQTFETKYIVAFDGDYKQSSELLELNFDYIFFTGSTKVGKIVAEKAAKTLTPVTLELGGKSPCILDSEADIDISAKRIAWGKCLNSGQTCVAPDYIIMEQKVKEKFVESFSYYVKQFFGENTLLCEDYPKIINKNHFDRLLKLMKDEKIIYGGKFDENSNQIEPTLIDIKNLTSPVMQEEIFGPILPIITVSNINEAFEIIKKFEKPLALYLFTNNKEFENKVINSISFGGGCINDTILHLTTANLPFGGVGESGMGFYHGKNSFEIFSHKKSILNRKFVPEINLRYPPFKDKLAKLKKYYK